MSLCCNFILRKQSFLFVSTISDGISYLFKLYYYVEKFVGPGGGRESGQIFWMTSPSRTIMFFLLKLEFNEDMQTQAVSAVS